MYIYFEFYNLNTMKKKTDDKKCCSMSLFIFKASLLSLQFKIHNDFKSEIEENKKI